MRRGESIGVVGLGTMGGGVAARLVERGFAAVGHDIDAARGRAAAARGATLADSPADVAAGASRVICLVDASAQLEEVVEGVAGAIRPGDVFLCMGTYELASIQRAAARIAAAGAELLDAPVSGGGAAAASGGLIVMAGGSERAYGLCEPVIEAISSRRFHLGGIGAGHAAKMVNNLLVHSISVAAIEGMVMGVRAGLDPQRMYDILTESTGDSQALRARIPRALARDFEGVPLAVAHREMVMEAGFARLQGVPAPLGDMAEEIHRMGMAKGLGQQDGAALAKLYEDWAGVSLARRA